MAEYREYMHIERINNVEVDGLLESGPLHIFPKVDGTNGVVWLNDDFELQFGSRHRVLSLESDNAGFMATYLEDENIKALLMEYPDIILYGEFLVKHTIKNYVDTAWRKFYVFDVFHVAGSGDERYLPYEVYKDILDRFNVEYIPCTHILKNPTVEDLHLIADNNHYLMKGEEIGEGIVIKNYDYKNKYGRTVFGKLVRAEFKANFHKAMGPDEREFHPVEAEICEYYLTKAFCEKEYAKVLEAVGGEWSSKFIPRLLDSIYHEFISENAWDMLKKFKSPTIDFKSLNKRAIAAIKTNLADLF